MFLLDWDRVARHLVHARRLEDVVWPHSVRRSFTCLPPNELTAYDAAGIRRVAFFGREKHGLDGGDFLEHLLGARVQRLGHRGHGFHGAEELEVAAAVGHAFREDALALFTS